MDYGSMVGESFEYAKEGLIGKWMKWLLLIISVIIFPLMGGYIVRILKGAKPSPELDDWVAILIDGIKLCIVHLIYYIPIIILWVIAMGAIFTAAMSGDTSAAMAGIAGAGLIAIIMFIVGIVITIFEAIAFVRFARTDSIGEAFNFSAILAHIGKIGWVTYIIALVILIIIFGVVMVICNIIPSVGQLLFIIVLPFLFLLASRYLVLLYDSVGA
jgi:hypothetical protein